MIRAHLARRRAEADLRVLAALRHSPPADRYVLWTLTELRPRRVDAALARLQQTGLVVVARVDHTGRHARELYGLACPCGADAVGAGHEPGCREAT